jgi:exonuclease SbcC
MMITRVKLKNWKSHRNTDIKLGDGTNVLVGMMGAGKSAVLDAITYALFGTLPAAKTRRIKLEDLITSRPRPADKAEVEVSFRTIDGEDYNVKRAIEQGKGTVLTELRKGTGQLIESGSSDRVTENVQALLKIDYDLYERAIYSEQNRLDYFLTIPKGKRMDSMDELLGINKLETARKGMGALANKILERAGDLEKQAKQLQTDESLAKLPSLENEIEGLEKSVVLNQERLKCLKVELETVGGQYEAFRKLEREISSVNAGHAQTSATAVAIDNQMKENLKNLGPKAQLSFDELQQQAKFKEDEYRQKDSAAQELNSKLTTARLQLQSLEDVEKRLARDVERLGSEVQHGRGLKGELGRLKPLELEAEVATAEEGYRGLVNERAGVNARVVELGKSEEELAGAEASCPVCESPLDDAKKNELLNKRRSERESLEKKLRELDENTGGIKKGLEKKRELLQRARLLEKETEGLPTKEAEYSKYQTELQEAGQRIPGLRAIVSELELKNSQVKGEVEKSHLDYLNAKQMLELRKSIDLLKSKLEQAECERLNLKQKLDELCAKYDDSKFRELEQRKTSLSTEHGKLEEQIRGDGLLANAKQKTVEEIRSKITVIKRSEVEAKHLRNAAQALGTIQTAIVKTQTALRQQFLESVNIVMGDIWESIYPYKDFVGIRLTVEDTKGGDYTLQLRDHAGNWIPVEGVASGGERTDACLALRIAFAMVLAPNLRWIVFDEPTHNLDAQGIEELAKIMRERLPEIVRQIILITHEERLEGAVSGYLYRFHRNKAEDEPTQVEQVAVPESYE